MKYNYLDDHLTRDGNNFDLIRLIAALAVIYGHAFGLLPSAGGSDLVYRLTGFYAGDLAVKSFFFLSGLLVTNSILGSASVSTYVISRAFRIIPGLFFVVIVTALLIGPLATNLPLLSYFQDPQVYEYIIRMCSFQSWGTQGMGYYDLPGVFVDNPFPKNANAPLWTLAVELFAYTFILIAFLVGATHKKIAWVVCLLIVLDAFLKTPVFFHWIPQGNRDFSYIPFCFAMGGLFAVYKKQIKVSLELPLGLFLFGYLFSGNLYIDFINYAFFFTLILYISTRSFILRFKLPMDLSYGVYLWGWPLQQVVAQFFPDIKSMIVYQVSTWVLAILCAYVSWVFIEKPAIGLGKRISRGKLPQLRTFFQSKVL